MTRPPSGPATVDLDTIPDVNRLRATVARLAADDLTGRRVGTLGSRAAATWLAEQLTALGATVTRQEFPVTSVRELYATPTLRWDGKPLIHRRDFVEHLASADHPAPLTAKLSTSPTHGHWLLAREAEPALVARAHATGALGILVPRGTDADGWMPKMIAGPVTLDLPILAVRTDLHTQMTAELGTVTATTPLRVVAITGTNIHAALTEGAPSVLLTAHYDGVGDDPDQRLPAAADNASGVAVVLEAARLVTQHHPPGLGLAVALLDAEEAGAHGSAHHALHVPDNTYVINIDGAAELTEAAAVEAGGPAHPLLAALDQAGRDTGVPLRAGAMASDNRRYAAAGLPAIGIGMGIPGYQTPAETPDRVNPTTLIAATRLVVATVWRLTTTHASVSSLIGDKR